MTGQGHEAHAGSGGPHGRPAAAPGSPAAPAAPAIPAAPAAPRAATVPAAALLLVLLALSAAGCGSEAPDPGEAARSATAAARSVLDKVREGTDAGGDVRVGRTETDESGRSTATVTVTNRADKPYRYSVAVDFKDADGTVHDAVVVALPEVPAGGTAKAVARSNRDLPEGVTARLSRAVRY
ncbi:hypothetical protein GCM10010406_31890 [Streptomyces thermolineatus]|uniref:Lipoprotein n=1 Tax=Streptomyces thermolineatus TaxID=44033 RepID=A0ABN3M048_9ACTN